MNRNNVGIDALVPSSCLLVANGAALWPNPNGGAPLLAAPMMNDTKGRCQHRKVMEPLAATRGAISRRSPAFQYLE